MLFRRLSLQTVEMYLKSEFKEFFHYGSIIVMSFFLNLLKYFQCRGAFLRCLEQLDSFASNCVFVKAENLETCVVRKGRGQRFCTFIADVVVREIKFF
mmetsp:Transcript_2711/g.4853  ORF Transcript_2711/g.4853 Transcript_2711/m.4853 type:complete len:98 (-) Transcript_2711:803-1096(-)